MDFIFGSDKNEGKPYKKQNKQLKTQIIMKQQFRENVEPTPLQKFKMQAKKNMIEQSKKLQIDQVESNEFIKEKSQKQMDSVDPQLNIAKLLEQQLSLSQRGLKFLDKKYIQDKIADKQNLVYGAQGSNQPSNYIKAMYQNIYPDNEYIKGSVDQTINNVMNNMKHQIQDPKNKNKKISIQKRKIPKTKDDIKQLQKLDKYRMLKIKQGEVKNKVGDLRNELQRQYYLNKDKLKFDTSDIVEKNYYSIDHPQTLRAQNLIHHIQQKRRSEQRRYKEILQNKQMQKQRIKQIQQQYEQKLKQQRKQKLRQFYEQKWHQRQEKKQQLKRKQEQFNKWIKMYQKQKPLEQKYEEQRIIKVIVPEIEERHKKLLKIKAQHKPIDIEQINEHDHRYMDYKRDQLIRQKAQIQMKLENDQIHEEHLSRYYKGKYRYMALQSMYQERNQVDPKQVQRSKKQRQLAYSDQIRYYHKQTNRRKQSSMEDTRSLIRRVRNHNGSVSVNGNRQNSQIQNDDPMDRKHQTLDPRAQGLKNLQYIKSHIREKLMNGQQKKPKINFVQVRQNKNYLQELRQQRKNGSVHQKTSGQQSLKNSSILTSSRVNKSLTNQISSSLDIEALKVKADNLDQKVKRKQIKHKLAKGYNFQDSQHIQDDYVKAINAKLKLVQELK